MTTTAKAPLSIGRVTLTVHDLDSVSRFYQQAVGLQVHSSNAASSELGSDDAVLLELRRDPSARRSSPREAGLFHTAFLLPTRADLGRWMKHAIAARLPLQGASDHIVSEAIYLADPEGNGIEIYADRPPMSWHWHDGTVEMRTDPLDIDGLISSAGAKEWNGFPTGSVVGHVHLQVGALPPAEAFYSAALGFDITAHYPGGTFYSTGGYHHHLATNIWRSRGAGMRSEPATGLTDVEIIAADASVADAAAKRLQAAGIVTEQAAGGFSVRDQWGTKLTIRKAA